MLTPEERVRSTFLAADCHFDQGEYPVALAVCEHLAARYAEPGRPERPGRHGAYSALGDTEKMADKTLTRIEEMLPKMRTRCSSSGRNS